jgi:DNA-binding NarL/FixJ family response regulator
VRSEELGERSLPMASKPAIQTVATDAREPIRVVLADDHPAILNSLEELFSAEPDILVVASCRTGEEALDALRTHPASVLVLVLDLRMPGTHGLDVLRAIRSANLPVRVVIFTAAVGDDEIVDALRLGARGLVLKETLPRLLLESIRTVHAGGRWLERQFSLRALDRLLRRETGIRRAAAVLNPIEISIVRAVAGGARNEQIADQLGVNEATLKFHLHDIYEKLGVGRRPALVRYALDNALI